jgi:hypothetical protein
MSALYTPGCSKDVSVVALDGVGRDQFRYPRSTGTRQQSRLTADEAQAVVEDIVELLVVEHGHMPIGKPKAKGGNGHDDGPTD